MIKTAFQKIIEREATRRPTMPRNPKTAKCWNCDRKYDFVYKLHGGVWGHCNQCDSNQGIIAPSEAKKLEAIKNG